MKTKVILKYHIPFEGETVLHLPESAQVLDVQLQDGKPTLWVALDKSEIRTPHVFAWAGTGWDIPESWAYCGTVQMGGFVWHLHETA